MELQPHLGLAVCTAEYDRRSWEPLFYTSRQRYRGGGLSEGRSESDYVVFRPIDLCHTIIDEALRHGSRAQQCGDSRARRCELAEPLIECLQVGCIGVLAW